MSKFIGERMKTIRLKFGYSQAGIAEKLGISKYTYLNYENGKRFPDSRFFEKFVQLTNVDLNWLFGKKQEVDEENIFDGFSSPGILNDPEVKAFWHWFNKYPIVRHAAMVALEDLKYKYKDMFNEEENEKITKGSNPS